MIDGYADSPSEEWETEDSQMCKETDDEIRQMDSEREETETTSLIMINITYSLFL
jgi:hypothetical protein